jgi:hypothetical protein
MSATMAEIFKEYIAKIPETVDTKKEIDEYIRNGLDSIMIARKAKNATVKEATKEKGDNCDNCDTDDTEEGTSKPININKGTGAGGANTNYYGKKFEEKTNNQQRLLEMGYRKIALQKKTYYLFDDTGDKTVAFVLQNGLKAYMKTKYNIDIFRCPDEAYIIEYKSGRKVIKILEKKEQKVEGSVETKLWAGPSLKREYELVLGEGFEVYYGFCVSEFLKKKLVSTDKKYTVLNTILQESNIDVLFGDDANYFETFDKWLSAA